MNVVAIDPGTNESALVWWDGSKVRYADFAPNKDILELLADRESAIGNAVLVVEKVECYGMAVGSETFETVWWSGRFADRYECSGGRQERMGRGSVKMHLCHSMRAKDANIRQALIDRFGPCGTNKNRGPLFGISGHKWAALALAVTWWDLNEFKAAV